ncbi:hypothetical protein TNCV_4335751 [Trichonephila clavipes]|nr:hypothetical protein TNCV_4335751 [Trichonephila clavipes]
MDHAAMSRARSQKLGSFASQQVSARKVRRRLLQQGLSARRPWLQLPLMLHLGQKRFQWCEHLRTWRMNGETSFLQISSVSVYSIRMVAFVFGGIVVNAHWQRVFVIAHHPQ